MVLGEGRFVMVCFQDHKAAVVKCFEWPSARQVAMQAKTPCDLLCTLTHRAEDLELPPEQPKRELVDWEK